MRQKITRGVVASTLILTILSLMFFTGLMIYNIRRVVLVADSSILAIIISSILVLIAIILVLSVVVLSFIRFLSKKEVDHKQYINILYLLIVFRLITYVFFSLVDFRIATELTGHLGGTHYLSYIFIYRTDLLPVSVFPNASIEFIHSLMGTDILSVGAVLVGFALYEKYRYAPVIGAVFGVVISLIFVSIINVNIVNEFGVDFLYYKVDSAFATLLVEFAMLGYVVHYVFGKGRKIEE